MKRSLLFAILATIAATALVFFRPTPPPKAVHYHAGFKVYWDGVLQDYTDFKYMNFTPCSTHDEKKSPEEEQIEKAHLHDSVGDVVHVHREGAYWRDLFQNMKVDIPKDKKVWGHLNGVETNDVLDTPIKPDQSVIIIIGSGDGIDDSSYVSLERIKEVEAKSELCGKD